MSSKLLKNIKIENEQLSLSFNKADEYLENETLNDIKISDVEIRDCFTNYNFKEILDDEDSVKIKDISDAERTVNLEQELKNINNIVYIKDLEDLDNTVANLKEQIVNKCEELNTDYTDSINIKNDEDLKEVCNRYGIDILLNYSLDKTRQKYKDFNKCSKEDKDITIRLIDILRIYKKVEKIEGIRDIWEKEVKDNEFNNKDYLKEAEEKYSEIKEELNKLNNEIDEHLEEYDKECSEKKGILESDNEALDKTIIDTEAQLKELEDKLSPLQKAYENDLVVVKAKSILDNLSDDTSIIELSALFTNSKCLKTKEVKAVKDYFENELSKEADEETLKKEVKIRLQALIDDKQDLLSEIESLTDERNELQTALDVLEQQKQENLKEIESFDTNNKDKKIRNCENTQSAQSRKEEINKEIISMTKRGWVVDFEYLNKILNKMTIFLDSDVKIKMIKDSMKNIYEYYKESYLKDDLNLFNINDIDFNSAITNININTMTKWIEDTIVNSNNIYISTNKQIFIWYENSFKDIAQTNLKGKVFLKNVDNLATYMMNLYELRLYKRLSYEILKADLTRADMIISTIDKLYSVFNTLNNSRYATAKKDNAYIINSYQIKHDYSKKSEYFRFENGVFDTEDLIFYKNLYRKDIKIIKNVDYEFEYESADFNNNLNLAYEILHSYFNNDLELFTFLESLAVGINKDFTDVRHKNINFVIGKTNTGKTVFMNHLRACFGEDSFGKASKDLVKNDLSNDKPHPELAMVQNKDFLNFNEFKKEDKLPASALKTLTEGGFRSEYRNLHANQFEVAYHNYIILIDTNEVPEVDVNDSALVERLRFYEFSKQKTRNYKLTTADFDNVVNCGALFYLIVSIGSQLLENGKIAEKLYNQKHTLETQIMYEMKLTIQSDRNDLESTIDLLFEKTDDIDDVIIQKDAVKAVMNKIPNEKAKNIQASLNTFLGDAVRRKPPTHRTDLRTSRVRMYTHHKLTEIGELYLNKEKTANFEQKLQNLLNKESATSLTAEDLILKINFEDYLDSLEQYSINKANDLDLILYDKYLEVCEMNSTFPMKITTFKNYVIKVYLEYSNTKNIKKALTKENLSKDINELKNLNMLLNTVDEGGNLQ